MSILDEKIKQGFDKEIRQAIAFHLKIPELSVKVSNDESSLEHTLIHLFDIDPWQTRIKLRLQEMERHKGAHLHYLGEEAPMNMMIRIEDEALGILYEKIAAKMAKKAEKEASKSD